jgi:3-hydroxybutyryl-CoA dehydrogenase
LECVIELSDIKKDVYGKIEAVVHQDAIIATNTSAIPISELQNFVVHPERFLGVHWAEPSYFTRFMEIICGNRTDVRFAEWVYELAHYWDKEPTMLKKDIRGFVTNRLMYAVYREGLHLVTSGKTTLEDVDKAFRYDVGSWITLMGIFRRMDFMGLKDYHETFKAVFPQFCNDEHIPALMQKMVDTDAQGTRNCLGLYEYTKDEASRWEEAFTLFNADIYRLAARYPLKRQPSVKALMAQEK